MGRMPSRMRSQGEGATTLHRVRLGRILQATLTILGHRVSGYGKGGRVLRGRGREPSALDQGKEGREAAVEAFSGGGGYGAS